LTTLPPLTILSEMRHVVGAGLVLLLLAEQMRLETAAGS